MRKKEFQFGNGLATKEPVSFRMDKKLVRELRKLAVIEKTSATALVARLVKEYVDAKSSQHEKNQSS